MGPLKALFIFISIDISIKVSSVVRRLDAWVLSFLNPYVLLITVSALVTGIC